MRKGSLIFLAAVTGAALSAPAYCLDATGSGGLLARDAIKTPSLTRIEVAGDNTPDPIAADRLGNGLPATSSTTEIPPADFQTDPADIQTDPADALPGPDPGTASDPPPSSDQTGEQQQIENDPDADLPPHVYSLQDFINQGVDESPLGMELREDCTTFADHQKVCGLAVLEVRHGSPAEKAGVKRYTALTHDILDGASVAAALVFPPAIVAVAVIDQSGVGESFDLVIGVDGRRVRHMLDFQDLTSNVKPGDTVYLMVVRDGRRVQLPVQVPAGSAAFSN
jgi:hypothetical protein